MALFTALTDRLFGRIEAPEPELDAQHALAALLVRMAKADHHYALAEIVSIDHILEARFQLNPVEAAKLRAESEKLEAQAPDTQTFTQIVQEGVAYPERLGIFETLWQVCMADGTLKAEEDKVLRFVGLALGVKEPDAADLAHRYQD